MAPIVMKMDEAAMIHAIIQAAVPKFFQHLTSVSCACLDFHLRHQGASGSASEFVAAPRELTPDCLFSGDHFLEELAMQLITDCRSPKAREWMLMQNFDLDEYLRILDMDKVVRVDSAAVSVAIGESTESPCAGVQKVLSGQPAAKSTDALMPCFNWGHSRPSAKPRWSMKLLRPHALLHWKPNRQSVLGCLFMFLPQCCFVLTLLEL